MRTKTKIKLLVMLAIVLVVMCIVSKNTVSATEYSEQTRDVSFETNNFNLKGDTSTKSVWSININNDEDFDYITNELLIKNIDQKLLNEYSSSKQQVNVTVKMEVPENTVKVTSNDKQFDIKTVNGKKYIEIEETLNYTNTELFKPVKDDVEYIVIGEKDIENEDTQYIYIDVYSSETEYKKYQVNNSIVAYSINEPYNYSVSVVNKYGQKYETAGGFGGFIYFDKVYLENDYDDLWLTRFGGIVCMPENINFKETYFLLNIDTFQGDTIEIENFGTLYYAGISTLDFYKSYEGTKNVTSYIYKNSLDKLEQPTLENPLQLNLKTSTNYLLNRKFIIGYDITSNYKEQTVTGTINIKDNKLSANVLFSVSGKGNAKLDTVEIPKSDSLYNKLENGLGNVIDTNKYNTIDLAVYDIQVIEGSYEGSLNLTFDVGTENNGKEYVVSHLKNGLDYEYFKGIVENGKITITVESLSPFMVSLIEEKETTNTDKEPVIDNTTNNTETNNKLDETPKTGIEISYNLCVIVIAISIIGIISLKRKF